MNKFLLSLFASLFLASIVYATCDSSYYQITVGLQPVNPLGQPDYCYVYNTAGDTLQTSIIMPNDSSNYVIGFSTKYTEFNVVCVRNNTKCSSCGNVTTSLATSDFTLSNTQDYGGITACFYSYNVNFTFKCSPSTAPGCKPTPTPKPSIKPTPTPTPITTIIATATSIPVTNTTTATPTPEATPTPVAITSLTPTLFSELLFGFISSGSDDAGLNCLETCAKDYNLAKQYNTQMSSFLCYYDFTQKSCVYH
ncbi:Uncharacterised protein [uncultured archaeon]|nr:Uncharacterised protein [uncultured archaeon]